MSSIPHESGIYQILCIPTGKIYIGSAVNLYQRYHQHWSDLRKGCHRNSYLQRAWDKYGPDAFTFSVLAFVAPENLVVVEQYYLDTTHCSDHSIGFNLSPTAGSQLGAKRSAESRARMSEAQRGKTMGESARKKIADFFRGRLFGPETREKIAASKRGKPRDEVTRQKLSAANAGKKHPATHYRNHVRRYIITDLDGNEFVIENLDAFCRERGFDPNLLRRVARGERSHHKGWKCRRYPEDDS